MTRGSHGRDRPRKSASQQRAEMHERGYIEGRRFTLRVIMTKCASDLGFGELKDPDAKLAFLLADRDELRAKLRELCAYYGDNDWDDNINLTDVLEKHLGRHLDERARRHKERRR